MTLKKESFLTKKHKDCSTTTDHCSTTTDHCSTSTDHCSTTTDPITIGIFDSGIGGLTVANAIKNYLPHQKLLYIGDTAHCPWGDKSKSQITAYSNKLAKFLIDNNCKIIVIACNTASCIAFPEIKKQFKQIKLFDVVEPTISFLSQINFSNFQNIGIIGTKQTINSKIYQSRIEKLQTQLSINQEIPIKALATPLLVPLIEEDWLENKAIDLIIDQYLSILNLENNSILILACTHYPLIKKNIENYYAKLQKNITIIDPSILTANEIKKFFKQHDALNNIQNNQPNTSNFYCTEDNGFFLQVAKRFFPEVKLEFLALWKQGEILI